jgi:hypothetical protein
MLNTVTQTNTATAMNMGPRFIILFLLYSKGNVRFIFKMDLQTDGGTKKCIIRVSPSPVCNGDKQCVATDVPIQ